MTWIADLCPHAYVISAPFVRAIGWLGRDHRFPIGAVPPDFVDRLSAIAARADAAEFAYGFGHFMGAHVCDICPPKAIRRGDRIRNAGVHNFAIPFAPLLFVCPQLVAHYVRDHGYRPPQEFIDAVRETPLPESPERFGREAVDAITSGRMSAAEQLARMDEAAAATEYGRVAATFRARLAMLRMLDGAVSSAASRAWTLKARCPTCGGWTYTAGRTVPRCCGVALVPVETRTIDAPPPVAVIVMGVSGAGKTTVGQLLAERNVWMFRDADDFHSPANVAKMRRGEPLTDADRMPWLDALHALLADTVAASRSLVLACSALKNAYRRRLVENVPGATLVFLRVPRQELQRRLAARTEHFFAPTLLDSQLAALEEPDDAIVVDGVAAPEAIVASINELRPLRRDG